MRRLTAWSLVLLAMVVIAGCGSSASTSSSGDVFKGATSAASATSSSTSTTASATTTAIPGLQTIATLTASGSGTTISEQVQMGPLGYGASAAPPQDALAACGPNFTYAGASAPDAWVHGQFIFDYSQGRLPLNGTLDGSRAIEDIGPQNLNGIVILNQGGSWTCGSNSGDPGADYSFTFQPGQTYSDEFWLDIPNAVTNSQAALPQSELNSMSFSPFPIFDQGTGALQITGPKAVDCGNGPQLFPFAQTPPFTLTGTDGSTATCNPIGASGGATTSQTST